MKVQVMKVSYKLQQERLIQSKALSLSKLNVEGGCATVISRVSKGKEHRV